MKDKICDISHHQPKVDFKKLKDWFVIHKCTEGTTYLDPKYKERKDKIQGSYHFAGGGDPVKEAEWYVKNSNEDFLCLDWEIEHSDPVGWCKKFITVVEQMTGKTCWLYTNDARATKYAWPSNWKFWIARYADYTGKYYPDFHPNFKNWSIHQYTSRGKVDGIEGNVDLNVSKENLINNSNTMAKEHEKNYKKIAQVVAKKVDYDYGDNPSNEETEELLDKLDRSFEDCGKLTEKIDSLSIKIQNQAEMINAREQQIIELKEKCNGVESMTITQLIKEILNKILKR